MDAWTEKYSGQQPIQTIPLLEKIRAELFKDDDEEKF